MESIVHKPLAPALASRVVSVSPVSYSGSATRLDTLAMQVSWRPGVPVQRREPDGASGNARGNAQGDALNSSGTETCGRMRGTYGRPHCT